MADTKLSALAVCNVIGDDDEFYINDSGTSKRTLWSTVKANMTAVANALYTHIPTANGIVVSTNPDGSTEPRTITVQNGITVANANGLAGNMLLGLTFGTAVNTVCQGNDARLSVVSNTANGLCPNLPDDTDSGKFLAGNGAWLAPAGSGNLGDPGSNGIMVRTAANTTTARTITVQNGITVANANGLAGDPLLGLTFGTAVNTVCQGNDARLSVVSNTANGLCPNLPDDSNSSKFLAGNAAWLLLGNMSLQTASNVAITGGNIGGLVAMGIGVAANGTDRALVFGANTAARGTISALANGANVTANFMRGNHFSLTLGVNCNLTNPDGMQEGQSGCIFLSQDATGNRTMAYGTQWDFAGGSAPTLSTAANTVDRLDYVTRTTTSIHAVLTKAWA